MRHLCDANLLLALIVELHVHHQLAADWFARIGPEDTVVVCRATQNSVLRLLTRKIAPDFLPLSNRQSWSVYDRFTADEAVVFAAEPAGLEASWRKLSTRATASPKVWMDVYLAAFAISGRLRLVTLDRDFKSYVAAGLDLHLLAA